MLPLGSTVLRRLLLFDGAAQVANLPEPGLTDQGRVQAVTIRVDHLRGLALLLANDSRRL